MYGYYVGFKSLLEILSNFVMLPFIKRYMSVPDTVVCGASLVLSGIYMILTGLSTVTIFVYLGRWIWVKILQKYILLPVCACFPFHDNKSGLSKINVCSISIENKVMKKIRKRKKEWKEIYIYRAAFFHIFHISNVLHFSCCSWHISGLYVDNF